MKTVGLIVEYNPFHNGHEYHLRASRERAQADIVICVMSGYFLQRGEPALLPRRLRVRMALEAGADIVVELPYAYASQHASYFARGAVAILNDLLTDEFYFGSETGGIEPFLNLAAFMDENEQLLSKHLKKALAAGLSYPAAHAEAFRAAAPPSGLPDLAKPNNILGYHYVKAARELGATIRPQTIPRIGAGFHEQNLKENHRIASATAVRKRLLEGEHREIQSFLPAYVYDKVMKESERPDGLRDWEQYFSYLQMTLATASRKRLQAIYEAEEGIENRFINEIATHSSFQTFMESVKTKRYTWTRLQRFAIHILTGTMKAEMTAALGEEARPKTVRLLGFSEQGRTYLRGIKKKTPLLLYTRPPNKKNTQQILDDRAARVYYLPLRGEARIQKWREEYALPPLYWK